MAKLRKFVSYRRMERPYTRISKFRKKNYIRMTPNIKIARFEAGDAKKKFDYSLDLVSKADIQIRQEAIEAARQTSVRWIEKKLGKAPFHLKIRTYPFHILRENPLAAGAGADRMSTGMAHSFGKPIDVAAQIKEGQKMFTISVDKQFIAAAKKALERASKKMPCGFTIQINKNS